LENRLDPLSYGYLDLGKSVRPLIYIGVFGSFNRSTEQCMDFKDYYSTMGVERDASQDEIKRAYRRLARKYHPDVSKESDAEERFKELGEAYAVLKDPETRAAYDQLGTDWKAGQDFQPPPNWDAGFEFSGSGDASAYSDFFESLFGHDFRAQGRRQHARFHARGEDHQTALRRRAWFAHKKRMVIDCYLIWLVPPGPFCIVIY